jgi:hypothetical protein
MSDVLKEHGFAGSGWGNEECALSFSDGAEQIHDSHGEWSGAGFESDLFEGVDGGEFVEGSNFGVFAWGQAIDEFDFVNARAVVVGTCADLGADEHAFAEPIFFHEGGGDEGVGVVGDVVAFWVTEESVAAVVDFEDAVEGAFDDGRWSGSEGWFSGWESGSAVATEGGSASGGLLTAAELIRTASISAAASAAAAFEASEFASWSIESGRSLVTALFETWGALVESWGALIESLGTLIEAWGSLVEAGVGITAASTTSSSSSSSSVAITVGIWVFAIGPVASGGVIESVSVIGSV